MELVVDDHSEITKPSQVCVQSSEAFDLGFPIVAIMRGEFNSMILQEQVKSRRPAGGRQNLCSPHRRVEVQWRQGAFLLTGLGH
jgi:hypothetical protein